MSLRERCNSIKVGLSGDDISDVIVLENGRYVNYMTKKEGTDILDVIRDRRHILYMQKNLHGYYVHVEDDMLILIGASFDKKNGRWLERCRMFFTKEEASNTFPLPNDCIDITGQSFSRSCQANVSVEGARKALAFFGPVGNENDEYWLLDDICDFEMLWKSMRGDRPLYDRYTLTFKDRAINVIKGKADIQKESRLAVDNIPEDWPVGRQAENAFSVLKRYQLERTVSACPQPNFFCALEDFEEQPVLRKFMVYTIPAYPLKESYVGIVECSRRLVDRKTAFIDDSMPILVCQSEPFLYAELINASVDMFEELLDREYFADDIFYEANKQFNEEYGCDTSFALNAACAMGLEWFKKELSNLPRLAKTQWWNYKREVFSRMAYYVGSVENLEEAARLAIEDVKNNDGVPYYVPYL